MRRTLLLWTLFLLCNQPMGSAAEQTISATIADVNPSAKTLTLDDQELTVIRKTKILVNGKEATLADIQVNSFAKVTFDDDLEIALSINVSATAEMLVDAMASLEGTWLATTEEMDGKAIKKEDLKKKKKTLTVIGDKFTLSTSGYSIVGKVILVPDEGANAIDLKGKFEGDQKPIHLRGIFEVKDDTLRLCYLYTVEKKPLPRPVEFETQPKQKAIFDIFERIE